MQEQLNFLFKFAQDIIGENNNIKEEINSLDNKLMVFTEDMLELINNDSETKKESVSNEKEN